MKETCSGRLRSAKSQPSAAQAEVMHRGKEANVPRQRAGPSDQSGSEELLLQLLSASPPFPIDGSRFPAHRWPAVVTLADKHGLTPFLYARLKQKDAQTWVPSQVWERMRRTYVASAVRSMCFQRDLRLALRRLRGDGIPLIVLKGAYLAEAVYPDAALRPMVDIDLLVPKAELPKAQAALLEMGGTHRQFEDIESGCSRKRHLPQIALRGIAVEIHWTIALPAGPVRVDIGGLWHRACPAAVAGVEVQALSPEDLLLHTCLHACYQERLGSGLRPLCDIAETVRRFDGDIDWPQAAGLAGTWGAARYVGLALQLARDLLDVAVPEDVLNRLVPGGLDRPVLAAARQAVLARTGYGSWLSFSDAAHVTSRTDLARLARKRVFLTREEMAATYPSYRNALFLPWYYARRVGHIVRSFTTHTLRRARLMTTSPERESVAALVRWLSGKS